MKLLLDTHVLIWWVGEKPKVPRRIVEMLMAPENVVYVSSVSPFEIALKRRYGKLAFSERFLAAFDQSVIEIGFVPLPLLASHMVRGAEIETPHKDPFDRMLAGQALVEDFTIVSADPAVAALGAKVIWSSTM